MSCQQTCNNVPAKWLVQLHHRMKEHIFKTRRAHLSGQTICMVKMVTVQELLLHRKKRKTNKQGTSIMYRKKNHILWVMCSKSYTAEALVPANALTAKNKVKRKQKVYGSSEFWSAQIARRGKVGVLLDRYSRNEFSTVPVYTPP